MRRTDDEFIKEVYERRKKHLKKKKQQIAIIAVLLPVAVFGVLVGPAMLPAASADKSAPPAGTVTAAPSENQSTTYPPGTIVVTVEFDQTDRSSTIEGSEVVKFMEKNIWSTKSSQSSSAVQDEAEDNKRADLGEKICTFSFNVTNHGFERYSYSLYENAVYDELSGDTFFLRQEQISQLKDILNLG